MTRTYCTLVMLIVMLIVMTLNVTAKSAEYKTIGEVVRIDPAINKLVPVDAKIELLAEGFEWSEGPVWVRRNGGFILFSDVLQNVIHQWSEIGGLRPWLKPSGYTGEIPRGGEMGSNGLTLDAEGNLVFCQHGDRRVVRLLAPWNAPAPEFATLADRFDGKRLNSPNDLAYHSSGALYFTDPPYGLEEKRLSDPKSEMDFLGVYRVGTDGEVTLLTDKRTAPNGIAFSPDEKTLYVAQSDSNAPNIYAYDVLEDGSVANERVFFDGMELSKKHKGMPDGLKVDQMGNLFATGPGGVLVITPDGKHLGTISTGQLTANCVFGDDGQTLYMTADMLLARIRLTTKGVGF